MRLIDADALIEFCAERWIPLNIDAVNMQPTIQPEKAQLSQKGTTSALSNQVNLCDSCTYIYPECPSEKDDVIFGNGIGNDNICACNKYQPTVQPVATDTISRQTAIDTLDICAEFMRRVLDITDLVGDERTKYEWGLGLIEACIADVKELPTVQPEPHWIPVSERLPEDYADVLVWFEYFRYGDYNCMYATHGIGNYSSKFDSWAINHETGWKDLRVFSWMPLPEPYKKGAKD